MKRKAGVFLINTGFPETGGESCSPPASTTYKAFTDALKIVGDRREAQHYDRNHELMAAYLPHLLVVAG